MAEEPDPPEFVPPDSLRAAEGAVSLVVGTMQAHPEWITVVNIMPAKDPSPLHVALADDYLQRHARLRAYPTTSDKYPGVPLLYPNAEMVWSDPFLVSAPVWIGVDLNYDEDRSLYDKVTHLPNGVVAPAWALPGVKLLLAAAERAAAGNPPPVNGRQRRVGGQK